MLRVEAGFSARTKAEHQEMDSELVALIDKQNRELEAYDDFNEHLLNRYNNNGSSGRELSKLQDKINLEN